LFQNKYIIPIARWQTFINETLRIPYSLDRNPKTTPIEEVFENPEAGTNCELLVQAVVHARGFVLPDGIRSSDLYEDTEYTTSVDDILRTQTGDIIGLCPINKNGFRGIHIGIIWKGQTGEVHIIHNARHIGTFRRQTIKEAMKHPSHAKIAWIKRPIVENPALLNSDVLRKFGLGYLAL